LEYLKTLKITPILPSFERHQKILQPTKPQGQNFTPPPRSPYILTVRAHHELALTAI